MLAASDWPAWIAAGLAVLALALQGWKEIRDHRAANDRAELDDKRAKLAAEEADERAKLDAARQREWNAVRDQWTQAFELSAESQAKLAASLTALAAQVAAQSSAPAPPPPTLPEPVVSARLGTVNTPDDRLIVVNLGPGSVRLRSVKVLNDPDLIVDGSGIEDDDNPVELMPGEEFPITLAITFGTPQRLDVHLRWQLQDGTIREREMQLQ